MGVKGGRLNGKTACSMTSNHLLHVFFWGGGGGGGGEVRGGSLLPNTTNSCAGRRMRSVKCKECVNAITSY